MAITYQIKPLQKHRHLKFAYVDGHHQQDFAVHRHDFAELFLVTSGSGSHTVASHIYPLSTGDVFVIKGNIEHGFSDVDQLQIINLMFDADTPFFELPSMRQLSGYQALFKVEPIARQTTDYQAKLTLNPTQLESIKQRLLDIKREYQQAVPGFEIMLCCLLQQLAIELSRIYQEQQQDLPKTAMALSRALIFIEQNFKVTNINSEAIASAAFVSKRQLERLFRKFLDTSPNQYLQEIRLDYGASLLAEGSERSVQYIAEQCGFADSNYFSKCFKQKFKASPRHFKGTE